MTTKLDHLVIKGASEHNLKNVSVDIPRDQLVVITGVSGSGKSSLAFDTIFAEGQRRYLESLSAYARQFLGLKEKPAVEQISGLSPVISIDQKSTGRNNPRSTVATVTEIYDYLRLLYARLGVAHDPAGKPIKRLSPTEIIRAVMALPAGHRLLILAPIAIAQKGQFAHLGDLYRQQGYARLRVDGIIYDLDELPKLAKQVKHDIEVVVDRVVNNDSNKSRISQSVTAALGLATGPLVVIDADDDDRIYRFSQHYHNPQFPDFVAPEMEPRTFSFNSPHGACPTCSGLGQRLEVSPALVIPNGNLSISEGALRPYNRMKMDAWTMKRLAAVAKRYKFSLRQPTKELPTSALEKILYGTGSTLYKVEMSSGFAFESVYEGVITVLERLYRETDSDYRRREIERFMIRKACHVCQGQRLQPAVLAVLVGGQSIAAVADKTVGEARGFFQGLKWSKAEDRRLAEPILAELIARLSFLEEVGLGYLSLGRAANTLSGGEAQRIRLATQIGSGLQGVLYVLDEPSIGLHQRDNDRLLATLMRLRDSGNSVLVVEHDEATIRRADYVVDVGPGAGRAGGEIVAAGSPAAIESNRQSLTGDYLAGRRRIDLPKRRRRPQGNCLKIVGAAANNLKQIDVEIPLGLLVGVSGVSGSGKSSLVNDILAKELLARLHFAQVAAGSHTDIKGVEDHLDKVIIIDQSPIGRTPRSNAATYVGLYTPIRNLLAATTEARVRGFSPGHFSFNVIGGRCEACQGDGTIKKEMHFLPDIYVVCDVCTGQRYTPEVLEVRYQGLTVSDILGLSVAEAANVFAEIPAVANKIKTLVDVGLGYITLGQPAPTLSGGEAQRVKLAKELSRRPTGRTIYILDEPTTGLHMEDVANLIAVLQRLVSGGNTVIVIEHNLDVLKSVDWLIDLGPEGGAAGGELIACGSPEAVAANPESATGHFLKPSLQPPPQPAKTRSTAARARS